MHNNIIAREGWPFIIFFALITFLLLWISWYKLAIAASILTIFCLYFFRNPERKINEDKDLVLAPADGRIMEINTVWEDQYLQAKTIQLRIFLNLFNVHVNRCPMAGTIEWVNRKGGLFLPAFKKEAGEKNARNYVGLLSEYGRILVVQITGLIARRIVCWVNPGDTLNAGERIGLIRFGSCTELYLPLEAEVLVVPGQKVKGGETIVARFNPAVSESGNTNRRRDDEKNSKTGQE